ncbi:MAG: WbqC family protein [Planctomycetota bacterium]|jgi:hypothetical protein
MYKNKISIMQPGYFPWPGFFDLVYRVDQFIIYDSVDYSTRTWRSRNKIRVKRDPGWSWLTVPVEKGSHLKSIKDVKIVNSNWQTKHLNLIKTNYKDATYFHPVMDAFKEVFQKNWKWLVDLDFHILKTFLAFFGGCRTKLIHSSDLDLTVKNGKTEKLLDVCRCVNADYLYESRGSTAYFDAGVFEGTSIAVEFQDYQPPVYDQVFQPSIAGLSTLDLVMNCGPTSLKKILGKYEIDN